MHFSPHSLTGDFLMNTCESGTFKMVAIVFRRSFSVWSLSTSSLSSFCKKESILNLDIKYMIKYPTSNKVCPEWSKFLCWSELEQTIYTDPDTTWQQPKYVLSIKCVKCDYHPRRWLGNNISPVKVKFEYQGHCIKVKVKFIKFHNSTTFIPLKLGQRSRSSEGQYHLMWRPHQFQMTEMSIYFKCFCDP